jgi:hypothetical protein
MGLWDQLSVAANEVFTVAKDDAVEFAGDWFKKQLAPPAPVPTTPTPAPTAQLPAPVQAQSQVVQALQGNMYYLILAAIGAVAFLLFRKGK